MSKSLRVISGALGSRRIKTLSNINLKPTPEKLREKLNAWLVKDVKDANCLDLFSGSGSLGIEAISNGAKSCTFVEQNPQLFQILKDNIRALGIEEQCNLMRTNAETFVRRNKDKNFSLINFLRVSCTLPLIKITLFSTFGVFPFKLKYPFGYSVPSQSSFKPSKESKP